jgi:hypothetical protein
MNLSFLKVRVADCPWILFDGSSVDGAPDWPAVARLVCARARGAGADGVIVAASGPANRLEAWTRAGAACPPPPSALLCAARWLLDAGRGGAESVVILAGDAEVEAMVIDSRNFGLPVGGPENEDGVALGEAFGGRGLGVQARAGSGVVIPIRLGGAELCVVLHDGLPSRRPKASLPQGFVEAAVVARHELRVRRGKHDPVIAAAAALAAAAVADYADREVTVLSGGDRLVAQWPEDGPVFVAAAPAYCLSGDFWTDEAEGPGAT